MGFWKFLTIPENATTNFENLWKSGKIFWISMEMCEKLLNSGKIFRIFWKSYGDFWNSFWMFEIFQKNLKIFEKSRKILQLILKIFGNPEKTFWISMEICEKFLEFWKFLTIFLDSYVDFWKSFWDFENFQKFSKKFAKSRKILQLILKSFENPENLFGFLWGYVKTFWDFEKVFRIFLDSYGDFWKKFWILEIYQKILKFLKNLGKSYNWFWKSLKILKEKFGFLWRYVKKF